MDIHSQPSRIGTQTREFYFSIPRQSLVSALDAYSTATGVQLLYDSRFTDGLLSHGVSGKLTAAEALQSLLSGTNLAVAEASHNVISLLPFSGNRPDGNSLPSYFPILRLNTLQVEIPPTGIDPIHRLYAASVRYSILAALRQDERLRRESYYVDLNVWVSPSGHVQRYEFSAPAVENDLNSAIGQIVQRVVIGQTPPSDLPQPVHVRILVGSPKIPQRASLASARHFEE